MSYRSIDVEMTRDADPYEFTVTVKEGGDQTTHHVVLSTADFARLGRADDSADDFVRRCFEFLLAREPKESILAQFEIPVIGRYFPEFEKEIAG